MSGPAPEVLRRQNVQLRWQLGEAARALSAAQMRNEILEAENKALHERLDIVADCESALAGIKTKTKEART